MEWTTIESDPAVFTSLVEQIGVKGVQVEELWDLSNLESLNRRFHLHGLIFLFKYRTDIDATSALAVENVDAPESLFFASQVITNACATQAILGVLLNVETFGKEDGGSGEAEGQEREQTIGETLTELKQFTADFPPELKGLALSNSEKIRAAHNAFARPEPIVDEGKRAAKNGDEELVPPLRPHSPFMTLPETASAEMSGSAPEAPVRSARTKPRCGGGRLSVTHSRGRSCSRS